MNFIEALFKAKINNSDGINNFLKIKGSNDIVCVEKNGRMTLRSKVRLGKNDDVGRKIQLLKDNGFFNIFIADNYVHCSMVYGFNISMLNNNWEVSN